MNKYHILSVLSFIGGIILLGLGASQGQGKVYWVVFIPVFEGTGVLAFGGILLIFLGFIFFMISFAGGSIRLMGLDELDDFRAAEPYPPSRTKTDGKGKVGSQGQKARRPAQYPPQPRSSIRSGGVIFIGPIPIIWGSDKRIGYMMAVVAVVLAIIFLIVTLGFVFF